MHKPACNYPDGGCGQPALVSLTVEDPNVLVPQVFCCSECFYHKAGHVAPANAVVALVNNPTHTSN